MLFGEARIRKIQKASPVSWELTSTWPSWPNAHMTRRFPLSLADSALISFIFSKRDHNSPQSFPRDYSVPLITQKAYEISPIFYSSNSPLNNGPYKATRFWHSSMRSSWTSMPDTASPIIGLTHDLFGKQRAPVTNLFVR